ncbi:MAG: hypothetical protein LIO96_08030, partial [Lachnospiraceae bacterium]|nr:hypothetical protein [Lachnospiraceae bacterium]
YNEKNKHFYKGENTMKKMIMVIVTVAIIAASFFAGMKTYEYNSDEYLVRTYCENYMDSTLTSDVEISDDGEWYEYESVDEAGNHYYNMARI